MSRFRAAGLWANPFDSIVPSLISYQPAPALRSFVEGETNLLIVRGPSGYGKSTAIAFAANEISGRAGECRVVYVAPRVPRPDLIPLPGGALLVDEANRLWPSEITSLVRLAREAGCSLLLATHRPDEWWLGPLASAAVLGLSPWRDSAILSTVADRRARHVQMGPMRFQIDAAVAAVVLTEANGVPLRALRFCYWLLEVCEDPGRPTLEDIPSARAAFRQFEPPAPSILAQLADWRPA